MESDSALRQLLAIAGREIEDDECWERCRGQREDCGMSRKTELEADLKRIGYQLGGAHLTRQARSATFDTFAKSADGVKAARIARPPQGPGLDADGAWGILVPSNTGSIRGD